MRARPRDVEAQTYTSSNNRDWLQDYDLSALELALHLASPAARRYALGSPFLVKASRAAAVKVSLHRDIHYGPPGAKYSGDMTNRLTSSESTHKLTPSARNGVSAALNYS